MTQNVVNDRQVRSMAVQVITASSVYTPPANLLFAVVEMLGGGAGGRTESSASIRVGGPGSAGSYRQQSFTLAELSPNVSITIGAGGTASTNGGTTNFGALIIPGGNIAGGGSGFGPANGAIASGSPSGGNINSRSCGSNWSWSQLIGSQRVGQANSGMSSLYGCGGNGVAFDTAGPAAANGNSAQGYGAGGAGGYTANSGGNTTGGSGTPGVVIITEFLSA